MEGEMGGGDRGDKDEERDRGREGTAYGGDRVEERREDYMYIKT